MTPTSTACRVARRHWMLGIEWASFPAGKKSSTSLAVIWRPLSSVRLHGFPATSVEPIRPRIRSMSYTVHSPNSHYLGTSGSNTVLRGTVYRRREVQDMRAGFRLWALQIANMQTGGSRSADYDFAKVDHGKPVPADAGQKKDDKSLDEVEDTKNMSQTVDGTSEETPESVRERLAAVRDRLREAGLDAREEARDWIRDKRDDMGEMRETLREARKDGRLREELTDQAKKRTGKLQELWNRYGLVGLGTYWGIYAVTIGSFYVLYDFGLVTELPSGAATAIEKLREFMKHTPEFSQNLADQLFTAMAEDHRARSLVLAWATCKIVEPLRIVATIALTPYAARAIGRAPSPTAGEKDPGAAASEGTSVKRAEQESDRGR